MLGRVFETVYASSSTPTPSTPTSTTWRRNPVMRLTRLAAAITPLERPIDGARPGGPVPGGTATGVTAGGGTGGMGAVSPCCDWVAAVSPCCDWVGAVSPCCGEGDGAPPRGAMGAVSPCCDWVAGGSPCCDPAQAPATNGSRSVGSFRAAGGRGEGGRGSCCVGGPSRSSPAATTGCRTGWLCPRRLCPGGSRNGWWAWLGNVVRGSANRSVGPVGKSSVGGDVGSTRAVGRSCSPRTRRQIRRPARSTRSPPAIAVSHPVIVP